MAELRRYTSQKFIICAGEQKKNFESLIVPIIRFWKFESLVFGKKNFKFYKFGVQLFWWGGKNLLFLPAKKNFQIVRYPQVFENLKALRIRKKLKVLQIRRSIILKRGKNLLFPPAKKNFKVVRYAEVFENLNALRIRKKLKVLQICRSITHIEMGKNLLFPPPKKKIQIVQYL